jgi:cytochrome c-type biogenesis protein CcmH/NrfG
MDLSSELQGARSAYFEALEDGEDVEKKKFTYAWTLIHQRGQDELRTGVTMLEELASEKEVAREALYFLATAQYRLGQLTKARATLKDLLSMDQNNRQAADLKALVESVLQQEGVIGLAILSGAVAAGGAVAMAVGAALLKRR